MNKLEEYARAKQLLEDYAKKAEDFYGYRVMLQQKDLKHVKNPEELLIIILYEKEPPGMLLYTYESLEKYLKGISWKNKLEEHARAQLLLEAYIKKADVPFKIELKRYTNGTETLRIHLFYKSEPMDFQSYEELEKYLKEEKGFTFNTDPSPYIINVRDEDIMTKTKRIWAECRSLLVVKAIKPEDE